ncbi:Strictosidine synthase [Balamuthia mandrillaris]
MGQGLRFFAVGLVVSLAAYYAVVVKPGVPFNPAFYAYYPSPPLDSGAFSPNERLNENTTFYCFPDGAKGPESFAYDPEASMLFCGTAEGYIYSLPLPLQSRTSSPSSPAPSSFKSEVLSSATPWLFVGGRPLDMDFDAASETLVVAEALKGLMAIDCHQKRVTLLAQNSTDGQPIRYANALSIASTGEIYFSDSSMLPPLQMDDFTYSTMKTAILDISTAHPSGRLLRYTKEKGAEVMLSNIAYANGVALSHDEEFVLIVETARYRVLRLWLKGERAGTSDVFVDNLPGFPDGISASNDGSSFWLAILAPRMSLLDLVHPYPSLKKLVSMLPEAIKPKPRPTGHVVKLSREGKVLQSLQAQHFPGVSSVSELGPALYLGNLDSPCFAVVRSSAP